MMARKTRGIKIVTVVGARPQFIKAAVVSRAVAEHNSVTRAKINEVILHTGQHYDKNMSAVFFDELSIPEPKYNLDVGSGSHGAQTGRMLEGLEAVLLRERPDAVLVYGDTNSTLAGALAASKLLIPVAHVEAGLRSHNKAMPEEQNRILTDHVSSILFAPTSESLNQLKKEGLTRNSYKVGDVMYDSARYFLSMAKKSAFPAPYILATVHRAENTDDDDKLRTILANLDTLGADWGTVYLPAHPRIRSRALKFAGRFKHLRIIDPLSYSETISAIKFARMVATDSGGIQKEALFARTPCLTLREETEWVETVEIGANKLVGRSLEQLMKAVKGFARNNFFVEPLPRGLYGTGKAGKRIVEILMKILSRGC